MLLTRDLIEGIEEQYVPMLKMVNIPDFTKCIAQFSGLDINSVSDKAIKKYLLLWSQNKYRIFKMLGNRLKQDSKIEYEYLREDIGKEVEQLQTEFPAYTPWLKGFRYMKKNKIERTNLTGDVLDWVENFNNLNLDGMAVTRFFKHYLDAPDLLIARLAGIFEHDKVEANYTLSIDPVDIMLASETPYNWNSCYRLELGDFSSHADGCIAALLDDTQAIAYVWDKEGKYELYGKYKFSSIRYKKMRQWVSISPSFQSIHFNCIYPSGERCREDLKKELRQKVETLAANYLGVKNEWRRAKNAEVEREIYYGYSEFCSEYVYELCSIEKSEWWNVYTVPYECPCGCGTRLEASGDMDEDEDDAYYSYNGEGFCCNNIRENGYCHYAGRNCKYADDCCYDYCGDCYAWIDAHPTCGIDREETCQRGVDDTYFGIVNCNEENCAGCPFWEDYIKEQEEEDKEE